MLWQQQCARAFKPVGESFTPASCTPPSPSPFHHHLPKPSTHPTLSSARPTPACRSESSALSQSRGGTQPPIRITGVFMHACFQEMEMKWRIVWEDLTYFALGWGDQDHLYNTLIYTFPFIVTLAISHYFSQGLVTPFDHVQSTQRYDKI